MIIQTAIGQLLEKQNLSGEQMQSVMRQIMTGECSDAQIGGFLIGLRMKGETAEEITAAAQVMLSLAERVEVNKPNLIDIVGTGGDGISTFNVSTAAALVAAGAGASVAKHGNRSVSSKSGSADLLEYLGANLNLKSGQVATVIESAGVGFMFAPMHHSAMRHAIGPRKEMAVRTIFNVLGPLTNPALVKHQVVGVFARHLTEIMANVLSALGSQHAMVVHSDDGMDEISVCAPTQVSELRNGVVSSYRISPEDFGMKKATLSELIVDGPKASADIIHAVLSSSNAANIRAARDIIALNAGAGIYVSGLADSLTRGVEMALLSIENGSALAALNSYVRATNETS